MCGIVVTLGLGTSEVDVDALRRAVASLAHRGPDSRTVARRGPVGLGHARLAIVDQRHGGQPLLSPDRSLALVANGEIYNAAEIVRQAASRGLSARTLSDNEAIMLAYRLDPDDFVGRLKGMFAFVLVDFDRRRLIAARDRVGIKPMFMHRSADRLLLASEVKALFQFPGVEPKADAEAIAETLTFGYPMGLRSPFEGVAALAPGHVLEWPFDAAQPSIRAYWQPDVALVSGPKPGGREAIEKLGDAVRRATRSHLMGEAPHLIYLSGGLDSSIIAHLLAHEATAQRPEQALSLHYAEQRFDESGEAASLAKQLGISFESVQDRDWQLDDLARAVRSLEQPQIVTLDLSMQSLSQTARGRGCKFVLAGDGADELFGGYDHFGLAKGRDFVADNVAPAHRRQALAEVLHSRGYPDEFRERYVAQLQDSGWPSWEAADPRALPWHPIWSINDEFRRHLMPDFSYDCLGRDSAMASFWRRLAPRKDWLAPIQSYVCFELLSRLPNWILLKSDRNAMANAIEVRVPFLDCDVIDAALACPAELVGEPEHEKLPLREAFGPLLGARRAAVPKKAFNAPHGWVFTRRKAELEDVLASAALRRTGLFDPDAVAAMLEDVCRAYTGGLQPRALLPVLQAQTMLGVLTTQMLFDANWREMPQACKIDEVSIAPAPSTRH